MKYILIVVLLFFDCSVFAQQTSVVIKSNPVSSTGHESKLFQASLNNFLINKTPVNSIKVTGLVPQGKYFLEVQFENDTTIFKTTVNILEVGFYHLYVVDEKGIQLKKIALDFEVEEPNQMVVKFGAKPIDILVKDTAKIDSAKVDTSEHYQMVNYNGKIGCPWPIKDDEFANFKINLNNQRLEDDKLNYCKEYLTNQCLIAKQVAEVLTIFEYEETKLDFAKFIYYRTFDIDNFITEIRPHFKFENSLDQLKQEFKIVEKKNQ